MMCQSIGRPPTSIIGFGLRWDSSLMRVPRPPARMTAFISLSTAASETAGPTLGRLEVRDLGERRLNNRYEHELGQPLHRLQLEGGRTAIPAAHHQWPLVVGVDQSNQIPQHDAVLMSEAGPRK